MVFEKSGYTVGETFFWYGKALKIKSPTFLIYSQSKYYMNHKQMMALKQKVLLENRLYKSIKIKEKTEQTNTGIYTPKFEL